MYTMLLTKPNSHMTESDDKIYRKKFLMVLNRKYGVYEI